MSSDQQIRAEGLREYVRVALARVSPLMPLGDSATAPTMA